MICYPNCKIKLTCLRQSKGSFIDAHDDDMVTVSSKAETTSSLHLTFLQCLSGLCLSPLPLQPLTLLQTLFLDICFIPQSCLHQPLVWPHAAVRGCDSLLRLIESQSQGREIVHVLRVISAGQNGTRGSVSRGGRTQDRREHTNLRGKCFRRCKHTEAGISSRAVWAQESDKPSSVCTRSPHIPGCCPLSLHSPSCHPMSPTGCNGLCPLCPLPLQLPGDRRRQQEEGLDFNHALTARLMLPWIRCCLFPLKCTAFVATWSPVQQCYLICLSCVVNPTLPSFDLRFRRFKTFHM